MGISSVSGTWEIGENWPYPKLYFMDYYIMAVAVKGDNLAVYDMTNSGNVWTATEKIDLGVKSAIISVDIATTDKYTMIVVNKGATKTIYQRVPSTGAISSTAVTVIPGGNSCCNLNGQFFIGGTYSTGAPWSSLNACCVAWGDAGSNIFLPGNVLGTSDLIAGFRKMPWDENNNGKVYKVLPINNTVMVYGDKGIGALENTIIAQFHAMKFKHLHKIGTLSTYSVNGNDKIHGFVDSNYDWNIVTSEGVKNLGYRNFLSKLTGEVIVSYEESNNRFYISDGLKCYIFTSFGMYSSNQCLSSIGMYKKILTGFVKDNTDSKIRIETTSFDFSIQDMKTIESVETGIVYDTTSDELMYGKLATKYDYKGDFTTLDYIQLNPRGELTQKITGREFKVYFQGTYESGATFSLNNIKVKIKQSDKRNTRGRINVN